MFAFIIGIIRQKQDNILILENNGIGYELNVSNYTLYNLPTIGEEVKIYTYFQTNENSGVSLYGFLSIEEKLMFLKLISVSGVGPKAAISILSNITLNDLTIAIATQDIKLLSSTKGIGKKTAERIVVELKDKVELSNESLTREQVIVDSKAIDEAVLALVSLGMNKNEALTLARNNAKEDSTAEEIIAKALRDMGN